VPASLAFHVCDIYLEELDKTLAVPSPSPVPLSAILSPFFTLAAHTQTNTTYKHIQETILDPLFTALKPLQAEEPSSGKRPRLEPSYSNLVSNSCVSDTKEGALDAVKLRKALLRRLFEVASEEGTRDSNRRKMYVLFKAAKEDEDDSGSDN
jgi:ribosomal RNA-processing protein 1